MAADTRSVELSEADQRLLMEAEVVATDSPLVSKCLHLLQRAKWVHSFYAGGSMCHVWREQPPPAPSSSCAGVDVVVSCASSSPSFTLTRQVGSFGQMMGEYVLAQILARERNLFSVEREMRQHKWWVQEQYWGVPSNTVGSPAALSLSSLSLSPGGGTAKLIGRSPH